MAAAMRHAEERDEAAQRREPARQPSKWLLPLGINLAVLALLLLLYPPGWVVLDAIEPPDAVAQEQSLRMAMYLQAQQIEAYRIENGDLPPSLDALPREPVTERVTYVPEGDRYRLLAAVGDTPLVYDSVSPDPSFAASVQARMTGAEG